jgi:nucleoside-diphosphate-sugar epimerase
MRVLVIGATGAIGLRLVPQLVEQGHQVTGTTRSPEKAGRLREIGAEPAVLDALDGQAVRATVASAAPDAIIYQSTALANAVFTKKLDGQFAETNRLRTEGTDNVLAAAADAGVRRIVVQSFAPYRYAREGGPVKSEEDPIDGAPPQGTRETFAAMAHLDQAVLAAGGIVLRYGGFYGAENDGLIKPVRRRMMPVIGEGTGMMSFIHLDDAAAATVLALKLEGPAVFNITDDDPAQAREWLPALAKALGAKPPRHVPAGVARLIAGESVVMMTQARGAANDKARKELNWTLRYPTWREGFPAVYAGRQ